MREFARELYPWLISGGVAYLLLILLELISTAHHIVGFAVFDGRVELDHVVHLVFFVGYFDQFFLPAYHSLLQLPHRFLRIEVCVLPPLLLVSFLILIDHLWDIEEIVDGLPRPLLKPLPLHVVFRLAFSVKPLIEDALHNIQDLDLVFAHDYHSLADHTIHIHPHMKMTPTIASTIQQPHLAQRQQIMEPEDNHPRRQPNSGKETACPINRQINRYRNALPEVPREEGHFFFKEVTRQIEEITYVSIGYRIGNIPFELQDIVAVIINNIHYASEVNLKLILDRDTLWVTGAVGIPSEEVNSLRYRVEEAHLNESLLKTQRIIAQFLQEIRNNPRREDKVVLEKLNKEIIKQIQLVFKNPDLED